MYVDRTTAYRLGSSACAAGGSGAFHPHDLRPHLVAFVATSRGHQAFQCSMKTKVTDRQGIGTQRRCRWSRRPRCHVTVKDSATIHQLEIATAGASAFCLDPCRIVDAGVDSYNDSSRLFNRSRLVSSHYPTSTLPVRAEAPVSATNHLTSYRDPILP